MNEERAIDLAASSPTTTIAGTVRPTFGDVLEGLVVVDLARTDIRLLAAYMGKEEAAAFQARHLARAMGRAGPTTQVQG